MDIASRPGQGAWWIALLGIAKPYFGIVVRAGVVLIVARLLFATIRSAFASQQFKAAAGF